MRTNKTIEIFLMLGFAATVSSCANESLSPIESYTLPHNDMHIGEYLQVDSTSTIYSFARTSDSTQLISISPQTFDISVLDIEPKDARELKLSDGSLAYRINREIKFKVNSVTSILQTNAQKLASFNRQQDFSRITYKTIAGENRWFTFKDNGRILADGMLSGEVKASLQIRDKTFVALQTSEGLSLAEWGNETEGLKNILVIAKGNIGDYVDLQEINGRIFIWYFDQSNGTLKIAEQLGQSSGSFVVESVDGEANKTYIGLDIAGFNDRGQPGAVYLDGWRLKMRWARKKEGKWVTEELPIKGAVGFYNRIIETTLTTITVASHNFRSELPRYDASFEDLAITKLNLR